MMAIPETHRVN